jgi:hypothetical protein
MLKQHFAESCVDIVLRLFPVTSTNSMAGCGLKQMNLNTQAQSVRLGAA